MFLIFVFSISGIASLVTTYTPIAVLCISDYTVICDDILNNGVALVHAL